MDRRTRNFLLVIIAAGAAAGGAFFAYAWEATVHPCGSGMEAHEGLDIMSSHINSPTNITLTIFNSGTLETTLVSYSVSDSNGDSYASVFNPQPVFCGFGREYAINIILTGPVVGQAFTFQPHNNYTIGIMTKTYSFNLPLTA